jgi:hypothetical protein
MVERSVRIGVLEVSVNNLEIMVSITYETVLTEIRHLNTLTWFPYRITPIGVCLLIIERRGQKQEYGQSFVF